MVGGERGKWGEGHTGAVWPWPDDLMFVSIILAVEYSN
jgi:hypothetical protein